MPTPPKERSAVSEEFHLGDGCPVCTQPLASETLLKRAMRSHRRLTRRLRAEAEAAARDKLGARVRALDLHVQRLLNQLAKSERRLEGLGSADRGRFGEEELLSTLQQAFSDDAFELQSRGRVGGDVLHSVRVSSNGQGLRKVGTIVWESKRAAQWSNSFIKQARDQQQFHETPYVAIVTDALPADCRGLLVRDGIVAVNREGAPALAYILRRWVVSIHQAELLADHDASAALCRYVNGDEFRMTYESINGKMKAAHDLLALERSNHATSWKHREALYLELAVLLQTVEVSLTQFAEA